MYEKDSENDYTHPRKGTETVPTQAMLFKMNDYTHPRKGTETYAASYPNPIARLIILIPARGRKLMIIDPAYNLSHGLYSSPQGDGNITYNYS